MHRGGINIVFVLKDIVKVLKKVLKGVKFSLRISVYTLYSDSAWGTPHCNLVVLVRNRTIWVYFVVILNGPSWLSGVLCYHGYKSTCSQQAAIWGGALRAGLQSSREEEGGTWELCSFKFSGWVHFFLKISDCSFKETILNKQEVTLLSQMCQDKQLQHRPELSLKFVCSCTLYFIPVVILWLDSEWVELSLDQSNAWIYTELFCFTQIDFLAWYLIILHAVSHILNNFLTHFILWLTYCHCFIFLTFLCPTCLSPFSPFISAPPTPKRFCFLRSKSQEKLLSPPSSSSRPSLSLSRRLRFWSSADISADGISSQPMSANGLF